MNVLMHPPDCTTGNFWDQVVKMLRHHFMEEDAKVILTKMKMVRYLPLTQIFRQNFTHIINALIIVLS